MGIYFTAADFVQGVKYFQVWILQKGKINTKMERRLGGYSVWLRTFLSLNFSSFVMKLSPGPPELIFSMMYLWESFDEFQKDLP